MDWKRATEALERVIGNLSQVDEATTSANVGAFEVPLGAPLRKTPSDQEGPRPTGYEDVLRRLKKALQKPDEG